MTHIKNQILFSTQPSIILLILTLFIAAKIFLLYIINKQRKDIENQTLLFLFAISITIYMTGEIAWFLDLINNIIAITIIRVTWNLQVILFYSFGLLLTGITQKQYFLSKVQKNFIFSFFVLSLAPLLNLFIPLELVVKYVPKLNILNIIFIRSGLFKKIIITSCGFLYLIKNMLSIRETINISASIPLLLKLQIYSFFTILSTFICSETVLLLSKIIAPLYFLNNNILLTITSITLFNASLLFFARRIYGLRFLNLTKRVEAGPTSRLTDDQLIEIKQALCHTRTQIELPYIHETFFQKLAHITPERITCIVRALEKQYEINSTEYIIEQCLQEKPDLLNKFLVEDSILVYDELAFTHFYEQTEDVAALLFFMDQLNAAIFMPLKQSGRLLGAILITKNNNKQELFPHTMQTQMQLYATYVTYTLARFEQEQAKKWQEEYNKLSLIFHETTQKNAKLHEALISLLKPGAIKNIGILFYKNNLFTSINGTATDLLQLDLNKHHGHPLTKVLKELVDRTITYSTPHTIVEKNMSGMDIHCQSFLCTNKEVIILISHATITNTLSIEQALLDPKNSDYLIFLQGTDVGMLVNQELPSNTPTLQKAKMRLLKNLLSKKAIFLDVHEEDIPMLLSIAKKVCHKMTVRTIDVNEHPDHDTMATLLFGKQLFTPTELLIEHGLLYTFDQSGIIHIANAQYLHRDTQKMILHFLKTGSFYLHKSERCMTSNATIIFSASDSLEQLSKQGIFLQELYDYLMEATITLPNLVTLPPQEFAELTQSLQKTLGIAAEYHHIIGFAKTEQEQLEANRPISYHQLSKIITMLTKQKMAQSILADETKTITEKNYGHDQLLLDAARLGKKALKDRKLMRALWDRFGSQIRIAELLDVDRSSVHRRLKEYGFITRYVL